MYTQGEHLINVGDVLSLWLITDIVAYRFQFSGVEKTSLLYEGPKARN